MILSLWMQIAAGKSGMWGSVLLQRIYNQVMVHEPPTNYNSFSELTLTLSTSMDASEYFPLSFLTAVHFHWWGDSAWPSCKNALFPFSFQLKSMLALTNAPAQYLALKAFYMFPARKLLNDFFYYYYCYLWEIVTALSSFFEFKVHFHLGRNGNVFQTGERKEYEKHKTMCI